MENMFSKHNLVEYVAGNLNVILTASHGGNLKPPEIPLRDAGGYLGDSVVYAHGHKVKKDPTKYAVRQKQDMYTKEIVLSTARHIHHISGKRPHVIINHLHRSRMDPNCSVDEGCFGNKMAEEAWTAFHSFIEKAQQFESDKTSSPSVGLLLDIHGQVHSEDWIELGYGVSQNVLNSFAYTPEMTSLFSLFRHSKRCNMRHISELISGESSLGNLLKGKGYSVVPSPEFPSPGAHRYYAGGLITEAHGSKNGGGWDAIQVECPFSVRRTENVDAFSLALAQSALTFVDMHYG